MATHEPNTGDTHPDRGTRFTGDKYQRFLKEHNLICPMSDAGGCADNAAAKSLFGLLKRERINRCHDRTQAQARAAVFDYIECFHTPQRRRRMELRKVDL